MDEKKPVVLIRRNDVEELLKSVSNSTHSKWPAWFYDRVQELPTLTVDGTAGGIMMADVDMKEVMTKTLHSISRSLDQLTYNLQRQLRSESQKQTNADWIRSMTDEEIATVLADSWPCEFNDYNLDGRMCNAYDGDCRACCLRFLKARRATMPKPKEGKPMPAPMKQLLGEENLK